MRRCLQSAQRHVVCMRSIHRPPVKLYLNSLYKMNAATHILQAATNVYVFIRKRYITNKSLWDSWLKGQILVLNLNL